MPLVKLDFSDLDGYYLIMMVPSLPNNFRYLQITNYSSGAYWMGYPEPPEMFFRIFGVRLIDLGDSYFALESTDEGIRKYLSVDTDNAGYIRATSSTITKKEKFAIFAKSEDIENNRFYLYSATGKFVTMVERVDEFGDPTFEAAATSETPDLRRPFRLYAMVNPYNGRFRRL